MDNGSPQSLRVSGSCHIPGGHYDTVQGSGSIRIEGNVTANTFHTSGSIRGHGALKTKTFRASGSTRLQGSVEVGEGSCSGSFHVDGGLRVLSQLTLSGSSQISGGLAGEKVRGSGALSIGEEVSLEEITWSGSVRCPGLISADWIDLNVQGRSEVGELAGAKIRVATDNAGNIFRWLSFGGSTNAGLTVAEVSGDEVTLEVTEAQVVRGDRVVIGPGCRIDRVEYRQSLEIHPSSVVNKSIQLT